VEILIDDRDTVSHDFDELDDLTHAYTISVHRSQGREYPFVVATLVFNFGGSRDHALNVKNWKDGMMALRWPSGTCIPDDQRFLHELVARHATLAG
jgi:hypothetical protein